MKRELHFSMNWSRWWRVWPSVESWTDDWVRGFHMYNTKMRFGALVIHEIKTVRVGRAAPIWG